MNPTDFTNNLPADSFAANGLEGLDFQGEFPEFNFGQQDFLGLELPAFDEFGWGLFEGHTFDGVGQPVSTPNAACNMHAEQEPNEALRSPVREPQPEPGAPETSPPEKKTTKPKVAPSRTGKIAKGKKALVAPSHQPVRDLSTGLFFANFDAVIADDTSNVSFRPDPNDKTIPKTIAAQQELVVSLVDAITNSEDIKEKTTAKVFANRWAPGAQYYQPHAIEKLAWRIVQSTKDLHENGCSWPVHDTGLMSTFKASEGFTFQERMDLITELLRHSKRTCEDILKGEKFFTIIGAPHILEARTTSNAVSNSRKAQRIAYATAAEKKQDASANPLGSSSTANNTITSTKKSRRTPRASKTVSKSSTKPVQKQDVDDEATSNENDQTSPEPKRTSIGAEQTHAPKATLTNNNESDDDEPSLEQMHDFENMNFFRKTFSEHADEQAEIAPSSKLVRDDASSTSSRKRSRTYDDEDEYPSEQKRSCSSSQ